MRNLIPILLAVVVLSSGCDPDGYSCNSEGCYSDDSSPQYQTLEDCLSVCDEITPTPESCGLVSHEGYDYTTVQIGDQCWFAENCRYLPSVSPSSADSDTSPFYYVYDYEGTNLGAAVSTSNYDKYGALYNWPAVMTGGLCPSGWHIPSDGEFTELTDFLGGEIVAGHAMKSTSGWITYGNGNYGNGSNSSGFNGLPGGWRYFGSFGGGPFLGSGGPPLGYKGFWWSASESGSFSWLRYLGYDYDSVNRNFENQNYGCAARCVRD
jgi:uncharacterized protein (TIGR02145 family)